MSQHHRRVPATHPRVIDIELGPADYARFRQLADDAPELRVLDVDQSEPNVWTMHVACASAETSSRLQAAW